MLNRHRCPFTLLKPLIKSQSSFFFLPNLHELAHLSFCPGLTDEAQSINSDCLGFSITFLDVNNQSGCFLKLDVAQWYVVSSFSIPRVILQFDLLGRLQLISLIKVNIRGSVEVEAQDRRS